MTRLLTLAFAAALTACLSATASADSLGTYGDTTVVGSNFQLSSIPGSGNGYSGIYDTVSGVLTPTTLTQLSAAYQMTIGTFGNGAPRFSIIDTTSNPNNEAYVYWGTPTGGGSFSDPASGSAGNTGNYADLLASDVRVYNNGFGGIDTPNTGETWAQFVASVPNVQIAFVSLDLDGGFSAPGQQMLVSSFTVNGNTFTAASAAPLPSAATMGLGMLAVIGAGGLLRKKLRIA